MRRLCGASACRALGSRVIKKKKTPHTRALKPTAGSSQGLQTLGSFHTQIPTPIPKSTLKPVWCGQTMMRFRVSLSLSLPPCLTPSPSFSLSLPPLPPPLLCPTQVDRSLHTFPPPTGVQHPLRTPSGVGLLWADSEALPRVSPPSPLSPLPHSGGPISAQLHTTYGRTPPRTLNPT